MPFVACVLTAILALGRSDDPVDVLVEDANGEPAVGEAVFLVELGEPSDDPGGSSWLDRYLARATTDSSGVASFEDVSRFLLEDGAQRELVLRLAIPPVGLHQLAVDLEGPTRRVTLRKPRTGSTVLLFDEGIHGFVRLRGQSFERWPEEHPCAQAIVDGEARFREVALGEMLEFEARLDGEVAPLAGWIAAPSRPGQEMRWPARLHAQPVLTGRVLLEDLTPVPNQLVAYVIRTYHRGRHAGSIGFRARTDGEGRFRLLVRLDDRTGSKHQLRLGAYHRSPASLEAMGKATALLDLDADLGPGHHDLGDVVLVSPAARLHLGRLGDEELEEELSTWKRRREEENGNDQRRVEACWQEMIRRGGPRWTSFLAQQFERTRGQELPNRITEPDTRYDLQLLTALRRAQRRPDPLALLVEGPGVVEGTFPRFPTIGCELTNVDVEGESFRPSDPLEGGLDRFGNLGLVVERADGTPLPSRKLGWIAMGPSTIRTYERLESLRLTCALAEHVELPGPGEYRVRFRYHPHHQIADEQDIGGWIVHESEPITPVMRALEVRLTREELADQRSWIRALPPEEPVWILDRSEPFPPSRPSTPVERLAAVGLRAVPALLDELADASDRNDPRLDWVIGMLWNLTGFHDPSRGKYRHSIGPHRRIPTWRTDETGDRGELVDEPVLPKLRGRLVEDWLAMRVWIDLEVSD